MQNKNILSDTEQSIEEVEELIEKPRKTKTETIKSHGESKTTAFKKC